MITNSPESSRESALSSALSTPRVDSRQMSWWAESADGVRDKELALILTRQGEYVLKEEEPGDQVVLRVYTPSVGPNRLKPVEITFQAPGGDKVRIDEIADALFWTESAVEKFLFPYYASQRLLTDEEMRQLRESFKSERVVAIWHVAPSKSFFQYGMAPSDEPIAVLKAEAEDDGQVTMKWSGLREYLGELASV